MRTYYDQGYHLRWIVGVAYAGHRQLDLRPRRRGRQQAQAGLVHRLMLILPQLRLAWRPSGGGGTTHFPWGVQEL